MRKKYIVKNFFIINGKGERIDVIDIGVGEFRTEAEAVSFEDVRKEYLVSY